MARVLCVSLALILSCLWTASASADSGWFYFAETEPGGTGHWYMRIDTKMPWEDAQAYAESLGSYLATITSQSENDFVWNNLVLNQDVNNPWLGGFQPPGTAEPDSGWEWVTGEAWSYTNWDPAQPQPDDYMGAQDRLVIYCDGGVRGGAVDGAWDDNDDMFAPGGRQFIIESTIAEPSSLALLAVGVLGLLLKRKAR